jgi:5'-deoxynucleotidase YfbR-like HD superfamily hydrolase
VIDQLNFLYEAGVTRRFHTVPVLRSQNIADHSWHVTMLAHILYGQDEPGLTPTFLMACMTHDMAECRVGDLPAPAKRTMDERLDITYQGAETTFRTAWGDMEEELLAEFQMDWAKFLTEEEKRRLKVCDALEGLFYCISERRLGNQSIGACFNNFSNYVGELLEDYDLPINKTDLNPEQVAMDREWRAYDLAQSLWSVANG